MNPVFQLFSCPECNDVLSLPEVGTLLQKENHKLHKFQSVKVRS